MRDAPDGLEALALEARWHSLATAVVLPLLLLGHVAAAMLAFVAFELGLAAARRRELDRRHVERRLAEAGHRG